ncbi:MAG: hypothetical protein OXU75_09975 [Deltaproteobacteria bacterium]|nr:hypothetical protein [Deltaproteobacteria bacterium]
MSCINHCCEYCLGGECPYAEGKSELEHKLDAANKEIADLKFRLEIEELISSTTDDLYKSVQEENKELSRQLRILEADKRSREAMALFGIHNAGWSLSIEHVREGQVLNKPHPSTPN